MRYYVIVERPTPHKVHETYSVEAPNLQTALGEAMADFRARNNLNLPPECIIEAGRWPKQ